MKFADRKRLLYVQAMMGPFQYTRRGAPGLAEDIRSVYFRFLFALKASDPGGCETGPQE
jgi:hypothetical protein